MADRLIERMRDALEEMAALVVWRRHPDGLDWKLNPLELKRRVLDLLLEAEILPPPDAGYGVRAALGDLADLQGTLNDACAGSDAMQAMERVRRFVGALDKEP